METKLDAVIVGGGLAGLLCARHLCEAGVSFQLLEASDRLGGRVRTDVVDGFLLDRGFQVFLTAYPEAKAALNYPELNLRRFEPGALIRLDGKFHRFSDPWRRPQHAIATAVSPVATLFDKLRVAQFRNHTTRGALDDIYQRPEQPTIDLLRQRGFSVVIMQRFLKPFLGGVFLDRQLATSSRMCEFVFRMFSLGDATLPANGMAQIPQQIASRLPPQLIRTNTPVNSIQNQLVVLESGERIATRTIVIATEGPVAWKLLGEPDSSQANSVSCLYFAANRPPISEPILVLNGDGRGPINNLCVPSQVSAAYAPEGQSLISVTVLPSDSSSTDQLGQVREQLEDWFGPTTKSWRHLQTSQIKYALPNQSPPHLSPVEKPPHIRNSIFICGDHRDTASINGALASGRRAAEAVLGILRGANS